MGLASVSSAISFHLAAEMGADLYDPSLSADQSQAESARMKMPAPDMRHALWLHGSTSVPRKAGDWARKRASKYQYPTKLSVTDRPAA